MNQSTRTSVALEHVNPLYGPGTALGWYLTIFAVVIAWTLHAKRSFSDVLDADFCIILMLPMVAAGHLIHQVNQHRQSETGSRRIREMTMAIEGPLLITEVFAGLCVPLMLTGIRSLSLRRTQLLLVCCFVLRRTLTTILAHL